MEKSKSVLIIDDERGFVDMLRSTLHYRGYETVTAYDGREGLEVLSRQKPDYIILDLNMPRMSGLEFLNQAMAGTGKMDVPTLVVTARDDLREVFKDLDVKGFISKPAKLEEIVDQVERILVRQAEPAQDHSKIVKTEWKVLWADDDDDFMLESKPMFESAGYMVDHHTTGIGLLGSAMRRRPDIVFMKLGLKDMSGDEVAYEFRMITDSAPIPLVLYSREYDTLNHSVTQNICRKIGIRDIFCFNEPATLFKQANALLGRN